MPARIRLQRHGRKGRPYFHIVVADQRSKRDGRFIEKLGSYNPTTNPATIDLDFDRSVHWVSVGAQPSETARAILSYKGVLMKEHLMRGVKKGAISEEQMEEKFNKWMGQKSSIIDAKVTGLAKKQADEEKARLATEKEKNDARAAAIVEANKSEEVEESSAEESTAEVVEEGKEVASEAVEAAVEKTEEAVKAIEEKVEEAKEVEKTEEAVEAVEEKVEEAKEETSVSEEKKEGE